MAETKDELPVLPEPAGDIRLPGWPGLAIDGYSADQMHAFRQEGVAAAQSRINALLEEVEKHKADVRAALEYAHDRAQQELIEARNLYGHYPLDGLGRKVKQASEQLEIVERAMLASLSSGRSGSGEVSNG